MANCRKCGKDALEVQGYLQRVNEVGVPGIWECRPDCNATLSTDDALILALTSNEDLKLEQWMNECFPEIARQPDDPPSESDLSGASIHQNPDADAWARIFVQQCQCNNLPHPNLDIMRGWFASAMMAMRDYTLSQSGEVVTNHERQIFGLMNLPEVVKGALFSRYSRSSKGLRELLATESDDLRTGKSEDFYDRVLIGYGDDSVAELGGAHIACEDVSILAAKAIEDSRLGLSPLEKSTRYVPFNQQVDGKYRYYREPSIMASHHAQLYEETLDRLFDTYTDLIEPLTDWIRAQTPQDNNTSDRAYHNATRAKALDLLRGLLPMATLTNVGLFGNGRAFEYLLVKLASSPHPEVRTIGVDMQTELDQIIPSFVKRAKSDRGAEYAKYLADSRDNATFSHYQARFNQPTSDPICPSVKLIDQYPFTDTDALSAVVADIMYPHSNQPIADLLNTIGIFMPESSKDEILEAYLGNRQSRHQRVGRAFESVHYRFEIVSTLGCWRDLQRHRICTQSHQGYTVDLGYLVPQDLTRAGLADQYIAAMDEVQDAFRTIAATNPHAAAYVVPLGYQIRWQIQLNLREAYHLIELRSGVQGHSEYRLIAHQMYSLINFVHPRLSNNMLVDKSNPRLNRLDAENRHP